MQVAHLPFTFVGNQFIQQSQLRIKVYKLVRSCRNKFKPLCILDACKAEAQCSQIQISSVQRYEHLENKTLFSNCNERIILEDVIAI